MRIVYRYLILACLLMVVGCNNSPDPTPEPQSTTIVPSIKTAVSQSTVAPSSEEGADDLMPDREVITNRNVPSGNEYTGCPDAEYPDWETSPYVLPFPVGEYYSVDLSNCSSSFHSKGRSDQFSVDFGMPIGALITASRAGTVLEVFEFGEDRSRENNYVWIDHGDGTAMGYLHLMNGGGIVETGVRVEQGDPIGYSGDTGLAGYPHLHLMLVDTEVFGRTGRDISIPFNFRNTAPNPYNLASYTLYEALPYD